MNILNEQSMAWKQKTTLTLSQSVTLFLDLSFKYSLVSEASSIKHSVTKTPKTHTFKFKSWASLFHTDDVWRKFLSAKITY